MENQTFIMFAGFILAAMGFGYLVSERFAIAFFYRPNAFGQRNTSTDLFPKHIMILAIRFILGPILLIMGSSLVVTSW